MTYNISYQSAVLRPFFIIRFLQNILGDTYWKNNSDIIKYNEANVCAIYKNTLTMVQPFPSSV